jgi:hypothetical protein
MKKNKKRQANEQPKIEADMIVLSEALRLLKEKYPWLPLATVRKSVTDGQVPSVRIGKAKRAHYFVRLSDLETSLAEPVTA